MNIFDFQKFKVLVDYGHNPESARAMARLLPRLSRGRKVGLCHATGSRTDEQIIEYGKALASVFDYIVLADLDPRKRPIGETVELVREGLIKGDFKEENIEIVPDQEEAVDYLFSKAETGDLLVIHPDELEPILSQVMERYRQIVTLI